MMLVLSFVTLTGYSQITIDRYDFPTPGLMLKYFSVCVPCDSTLVDSLFDIGTGSAGEAYDFYNLTSVTTNNYWTEEYTYPFLTPMGNDHQVSNMAIVEELELAQDQSVLSRVDLFGKITSTEFSIGSASFILDSTIFYLDSVASASGKYDSINVDFSDPIRILTTGHTFGATIVDTVTFSYEALGGRFKFDEIHSRKVTVDGYGSLMSPYGTFQVLRFKVEEYDWEQMDSAGVVSSEGHVHFTYEYWAKGIGSPVVVVDMDSTWSNIEDIDWLVYIYTYGDTLCETSCVWPGDANGDLAVDHYDILPLGLNFSQNGPGREYETDHWMAFPAEDWVDTLRNGANMKHADCNGDSLVNFDDVNAIKQNFQMPVYKSSSSQKYNSSNPDLYFDVLSTDVAPGSTVEISLMAGRDTNVALYGLGFEIMIDPNLYEPNTLALNWDNCWLGTANQDMLVIKKINEATGNIFAGCVRNNSKNVSSFGELARITFTVSNAITDSSGFAIQATTSGGVDSSGTEQAFNGSSDTVIVGIPKRWNGPHRNNVKVYPNPTEGKLYIDLSTNAVFHVQVMDILGKVVWNEQSTFNTKAKLDISSLPEGIYIVRIERENNDVVYKKINLIK
ncbi:T9SS type A sorting domain-containing protein [Cytophagaceae bacterium AH-315-L13]|nr:T9SS type A sorting domain-containing protein [Cytophagaceae bacterium AH-315-L13]